MSPLCRANIGLRKVESETASRSHRAMKLDFAAQQVAQLATDGQTQSRAAVFAARPCIGLLERLKDNALLCRLGIPMPVSDTSNATTDAALLRTGWSLFQPPLAENTESRIVPCSVNLKALERRFFRHLLQALGIGNQALAQAVDRFRLRR